MTLSISRLKPLLCLVLLLPAVVRAQGLNIPPPAPPTGVPVFTIIFEAKAQESDLSAESRVKVRFAPGPVWHGTSGAYKPSFVGGTAEDSRTPASLFKLRGSLAGLRPDENMCFGMASHSGFAKGSSGATLNQPGQAQLSSDGTNWTLEEDGARFRRTESGGVLECSPVIYMEDNPPEFGLLGPGAYDYTPEGEAAMERLARFTFTNEELSNWSTVRKVNEATVQSQDGQVRQWFRSTLTTDTPDDEVEVSVKPDQASYETWIPKGNVDKPTESGNDPLEVTVTVHQKGDKQTLRQAYLKISLPYVSKNQGICGNWPKNVGEEEGLRFRQKDFPETNGLLFKDRTHLETDILVEKVTFRVYSYEYGAWGTLRITATDADGKDIKVQVQGKDTPDLDIPLDDNSNRIADVWEKGKPWNGKDKDWDSEEVPGQDAMGDGITLYNEYRGILVPDGKGGKQFIRLDPDVKEMFILDPNRGFPTAKWGEVAGIKVYRLEETLVDPSGNPGPGKSPLVNFNAADRLAHPVYALKIVVRTDEPTESLAPAFAQMADGTADNDWCIKKAIAVNVVPARFERRIEEDFVWLDTAILKPDSPEGLDLRNIGPKEQINYDDAHNAWSRLVDPNLRKAIAAKLQTAVFLHEAGHVCLGALADHSTAAPTGHEDEARECLMFLQATWGWGRRRTLVFTALGMGDKDLAYPYRNFCRDIPAPGYHCYKSLKIKDW